MKKRIKLSLYFKAHKLLKTEKNWEYEKIILNRYNQILAEKSSLLKQRKELTLDVEKQKRNTTKFLIGFLFINFTIVEVYSMWMMFYFADLSSLYVLITAVIGETIAFATYVLKSTRENTVGGVVYETAMKHLDEEMNRKEPKDLGGVQ